MNLIQIKCSCCGETAGVIFKDQPIPAESYCPICAEAMLFVRVNVLDCKSFEPEYKELQRNRGLFVCWPQTLRDMQFYQTNGKYFLNLLFELYS